MKRGLTTCLSMASVAIGFALLAPSAQAQFNINWLSMTKNDALMKNANGTTHASETDVNEKDYAVSDVDNDGDQDMVVVRKTPVSFTGPFPNFLFLNEGGTLIDRTSAFATASLTGGDTGFNRPTDSRDAEFGDFNNDGWLDFIETNTDLQNQTGAAAKVTTHPRVYMNLASTAGAWNGLRHEDARIPQLKTTGGVNGVVRFCDSALGDPDKDGDIDLYFVDYDTDENGHSEPSNLDLNDRLLANDGNGFFTDVTSLRMTAAMSSSTFGTECVFADVNGDTRLDIVKITTLTGSPLAVECIYNDANSSAPNGDGFFDLHQNNAWTGQPYTMAIADLNNDGRLDMAVGDDGIDGYRFNTGNNALGQVNWGSKINFTWLTGSNDLGFPGQMYANDYNCDGWNDVLITDVDIDLLGCNRRTQFYHNRTGAVGGSIILAEEKQQSGTGGWFGIPGWNNNYPKGAFDAANIDLDGDGDLEVILGMCSGTDIWVNNTKTGVVCQTVIGQGGLGNADLEVCGQSLATGNTSTLSITAGPANGVALLFVSFAANPIAAFGGTLWTNPIALQVLLPLNGSGALSVPVPGGGGPVSVFTQAIVATVGASLPTSLTPAVRLDFLP